MKPYDLDSIEEIYDRISNLETAMISVQKELIKLLQYGKSRQEEG